MLEHLQGPLRELLKHLHTDGCPEENLWERFRRNQMSAEEKRLFEQHLKTCPACFVRLLERREQALIRQRAEARTLLSPWQRFWRTCTNSARTWWAVPRTKPLLVTGGIAVVLLCILATMLRAPSDLFTPRFPAQLLPELARHVQPAKSVEGRVVAGSELQQQVQHAIQLGVLLTRGQLLAESHAIQQGQQVFTSLQQLAGRMKVPQEVLQKLAILRSMFTDVDAKSWQALPSPQEQVTQEPAIHIAIVFGIWIENVRLLSLVGTTQTIQMPDGLLQQARYFRKHFEKLQILPHDIQNQLLAIEMLASHSPLTSQEHTMILKSLENFYYQE